MLDFLKQLFSTRRGDRTIVIVDDDGTKPSNSFRHRPIMLWLASAGVIAGVILIVVILLRFTPLSGLVYDRGKIRQSVITIQQKVAALQDTIEARNIQLNKMQNIIREGGDTSITSTFGDIEDSPAIPENEDTAQSSGSTELMPMQRYQVQRLPADAVLISNLFSEAPDFPAPFPVQGTSTRTFNIDSEHYGLDIAASRGEPFRVIADGVILNQEWTFNYGFVIIVQHANGIVSVYKHALTVDKAIGETVRSGDILGTLGDVGILSSGPHLHLEIWKRGIPQNPLNYLVQSE